MREIIKSISDSFIKEAIASPRMLEDLASMERYMSESYDGRTFVELIQNADDALSSAIRVFSVGDTLIVANNGRPFNKADIMAICRSGSSNKQRGNSIGYRGVGFKSATTISSEIVIYSADTFFTFSKELCAKTLNKTSDKVPTVRIPFPYHKQNLPTDVIDVISRVESLGFTTFFVFLHANISKFSSELTGFNSGWLLFLKNITRVEISLPTIRKECKVTRNKTASNDTLVSIAGSEEKWYIVSEDTTSLAFRYDESGIIPCSANDACYHCYLPTMDKCGFPFKVNADFSTDPSRKHLITDDLTKQAFTQIQRMYASLIIRAVKTNDAHLFPVIALLCTPLFLNELSSELERGIIQYLRNNDWIPLNTGLRGSPENIHLFPSWLTAEEQEVLTKKAAAIANITPSISALQNIDKLDKLLSKIGVTDIPLSLFSALLKQIEVVNTLDDALTGKLFVHSCRAHLSNQEALQDIYVPLADQQFLTMSALDENSSISVDYLRSLNLLSSKDKNSLVNCFGVFACLLKANFSQPRTGAKIQLAKPTDSSKENMAINKWKTPVQNCIAVETLKGNSAKDAGKKCTEYDVITTTPEGSVSYIAVKSVGVLGDSFSLSEDEYAAAERLGDNYWVYLFTTATSNIKYSVIINPIKAVKPKKVVKEWEWLCESSDPESPLSDSILRQEDHIYSETNSVDVSLCDKMSGQEFELFCARLLIKNGYEDVTLTKTSGDQGIDIIAYRDGIKYGIQCKCYSNDIGNSAVQEAFAGKTFYNCNVAIVLTNQHFSPSAIQLSESNGVILWGREFLMKLIKTANKV